MSKRKFDFRKFARQVSDPEFSRYFIEFFREENCVGLGYILYWTLVKLSDPTGLAIDPEIQNALNIAEKAGMDLENSTLRREVVEGDTLGIHFENMQDIASDLEMMLKDKPDSPIDENTDIANFLDKIKNKKEEKNNEDKNQDDQEEN